LKVITQAESETVPVGQSYKAKIFFASYDTTQYPEVYVENKKLPVKSGKGIYKEKVNNTGKNKRKGYVELRMPSGEIKKYPFEINFEVK
jgi:hypothetical protein